LLDPIDSTHLSTIYDSRPYRSFSPLELELLELTSPVMITGNKTPDGDTVGCAVAIYHFLKHYGIPSFLLFGEEVQPRLKWMLHDVEVWSQSSGPPSRTAQSLVVVDDYPCSERLGVTLPPSGTSTVVIDHHIDNPLYARVRRPSGQGDAPALTILNSGITDIRCDQGIIYGDRPTSLYWSHVPSTACILIDLGILHPYLWCSLATDSVFFTVDNVTVSKYVQALAAHLELPAVACRVRLTDERTSQFISALTPKASLSALDALTEPQRISWEVISSQASKNAEAGTMCFASVSVSDPGSFKTILSILCRFANIVCLYNRNSGKVSLRSDLLSFSVNEIAAEFGGGGHKYAAGCCPSNKNRKYTELKQVLTDKFRSA